MFTKKFSDFIENSKHIINISYKPTKEEFNKAVKLTLLGIIIIGVLGFIISLIISIVTGTPL
ncbi:MAG: protein translocase SEC61 complex subunit gamma [Candidatus Marsarchaeota archaeon]|jgi:protein transport protein SEC61 subunit gamma-like protein|nr:protein translocase SEC61 complex subunit gamma [Candidatus Marsarchaeota archaeon]